ncbi:GntR family transcriptional regulator [Kineosporia succinea]|uniref:DNA-binding GntR family transcriptional regulator n=1 Tax=Kineosporia succinea TaxID=84632 RepID=A0ABT9P7V4_9ACTN|nr:GntR family transcriptional regulator [Kineosporia succinea]MDP9828542.1 DNA-binding GntR family transcriptional regulator [Kineosporia succinea]
MHDDDGAAQGLGKIDIASQMGRDRLPDTRCDLGDERVIENQLTATLGVSRPPLREALRILQQEGLIEQVPRRGAVVRVLTLHDVYEIVTLRTTLETMAVRLGVPCHHPTRLERLRSALEEWERNAADGREDLSTEDSSRFHLAFIALAGHSRLDDAYRAIALQLRMCMQLNRAARSSSESLSERAARHRRLFGTIESGDATAVLAEMADPASLSFVLSYAETHPPTTPESRAWLESITGPARAGLPRSG